ncbi:MAG TPA: alpha/beta fold hydrolase, partial [Anaerolineales bacterium]
MTIGLILLLLSVWQIQAAQRGLQIISIPAGEQPPMTVFIPGGENAGSRPVVLVAHGLAGSGVVMRGFALTLAHAGYNVVTWDFTGHGSNPRPLESFTRQDVLLADAEQALAEAVRRGLVTGEQVAILGHSMGSGVALAYGQKNP